MRCCCNALKTHVQQNHLPPLRKNPRGKTDFKRFFQHTRWHVLFASLFFFVLAWQFSHLYSVQSVKIFGTANTACDVTVILSRFLFSSEVVSHIAFGDVSHLHCRVYSLVSSEGKNVRMQHATSLQIRLTYFLCPTCGNPVMFSPPQHRDYSEKICRFAQYFHSF